MNLKVCRKDLALFWFLKLRNLLVKRTRASVALRTKCRMRGRNSGEGAGRPLGRTLASPQNWERFLQVTGAASFSSGDRAACDPLSSTVSCPVWMGSRLFSCLPNTSFPALSLSFFPVIVGCVPIVIQVITGVSRLPCLPAVSYTVVWKPVPNWMS